MRNRSPQSSRGSRRAPYALLIAAAMATGCTAPLAPVTYEEPVLVSSTLPAYVKLNTGRVIGQSVATVTTNSDGAMVPVTLESTPELQFNETDQAVFVDSLKAELLRHGIVGSLASSMGEETLLITVDFVLTEHQLEHQTYQLTTTMQLRYGEYSKELHYKVASNEGDSLLATVTTSSAEGKEKAADKLLTLLIPDIEAFIATQTGQGGTALRIPTDES